MYSPFSLEGKTIVVTGASSGIGRQCAIDCSRMGAKVALVARDRERLEDTVSKMDSHHDHRIYQYDLSITEGIKNLVADVVSDCGKIDGFVHAAGIEKTAPARSLSFEDYRNIYSINALSAFEFIRQFSSRRCFSDGGHIVLISSITSTVGRIGVSAYAASKGALVSAVRTLALELAPKRICINCVSPGTILTPMMQNFLNTLSEEQYKKRIDGFPLGLGDASDVSNTCIFLLSSASRWITGQNIIVDGGYTIQ